MAQAVDRFSDQIKVLTGVQWNADTSHSANLSCPHASAVDDHVCFNVATIIAIIGCPLHTCDTTIHLLNGGHPNAFLDHGTAHSCTFGECQCDIGWIGLAIARQMHRANNTVDVEMWVQGLGFFGTDRMSFNVKGTRQTGLAINLFFSGLGEGNGHAAVGFHARRNTGLFFEFHVQVGRILGQPR